MSGRDGCLRILQERQTVCSRRLFADLRRIASSLLLQILQYLSSSLLALLGTRRKYSVRKPFVALATVFVLVFFHAPRASAEPVRLLIAVGHRMGLVGEIPLKHAVHDAKRVRDVFVQYGGVRPENAIVLEQPTAAALTSAFDRVADLARSRRSDDVTLLFYFSGHGDRENLHLGAEAVSLHDIDAKLGAIPAALRIVVTDACRTADVRAKGVSAEDAFAITANPGEQASGLVKIHASADGEVAQESDELAGAVFTHYFVTGLGGAADVDGDSRVTLAEAYSFAYHQTLYRSTRSSGAVQRAAAAFDLKEAAPFVLTQPSNTSRIGIPRSTDVRYLVFATGSRTVLAELYGSGERVLSVAVPAGRYIVQRRGGSRSGAAHVALGSGESRELTASDFQSVSEETLARKGGEMLFRRQELGIAYGTSVTRLVSFGQELAAHYAYELDGGWAVSIGGRGGLGSRATNGQEANLRWLGLDGLFEYRFRSVTSFGAFGLRAGAGPTVEGVTQNLRRDDANRLALAGYVGARDSRAVLVGGSAAIGARTYFGDAFYVGMDGVFRVLAGGLQRETTVFLGAGLSANVGLTF